MFRYESQFDVFVESRSLPVYAAESLTKISHMGLNFLVVSSPYQQTVSVWQWVDHLEFTRLTEIRSRCIAQLRYAYIYTYIYTHVLRVYVCISYQMLFDV